MNRWLLGGLALLLVAVIGGMVYRQLEVDRDDTRRAASGGLIGDPFGMGGTPWLWTVSAEADSAGCAQEISALESVLEVVPDYAPAHRALSLACASAGSTDRAIAEAETYALLRPGEADVPFLLASVCLLAGRYDRVLETLDPAREPDSLHCWALALRGRAYSAKGMYERALESYEEILRRAPYDLFRSDAYFEMGRVRILQGNTEGAAEAFERSAYAGRDDARVHWGRAWVLGTRGDTGGAWSELAQAEGPDPGGEASGLGLVRQLRGRLLMAEGRWEEAVTALEGCVEASTAPAWPEALTDLGEAYWRAGRPVAARDALEHCFRVNPAWAPARALSARLYEAQGDSSLAAREYEAVLDILRDADPGLPLLEDAKRRFSDLQRRAPL